MFIKDSSDGIGKVVTVFFGEKVGDSKKSNSRSRVESRGCEIWSPVIFFFHPPSISQTLSAKHKLAKTTGEGVSGCKWAELALLINNRMHTKGRSAWGWRTQLSVGRERQLCLMDDIDVTMKGPFSERMEVSLKGKSTQITATLMCSVYFLNRQYFLKGHLNWSLT